MRRAAVGFLFIVLAAAAALPAHAQFDRPREGADVQPLGKSATTRWRVGMVINAVGGPVTGLFGTITVPSDWPEQQVRVVDEEITTNAGRITYRELDGGVKQMLMTIPRLEAGEEARILITFEVVKHTVPPPENPASLAFAKSPPREVRLFLAPSPFIDPRHSAIRAKVKEVVDSSATPWSQVEALYDWVRANVKHEEGALKGSVEALRDGFGSKEDLNSLFIALCRAHDVPARTVWVSEHQYAEFYLEDSEGKGRWFPAQAAGDREFGFTNDTQPILQRGDNFKPPEQRDRVRFVPEFLNGKGSGRPEVSFVRVLLPA